MKCLNHSVMVFWLVVLLVGFSGIASGETTPPTYSELLIELTEIWKESNSLSVNSAISLMDMQEAWPDLVQKVAKWGLKFEAFEKTFNQRLKASDQNMEIFNQDFSTSLMELTELRDLHDEVLLTIEDLRTSFTNIEDEVKKMKFRNNIGLGLSITAVLIAIGTAVYEYFNKQKEVF